MANLFKYIQTINEASDNKGIEYEKTIFHCFMFIENKIEILEKLKKKVLVTESSDEETSDEEISDEDKKNLENLEKLKIKKEELENLKTENESKTSYKVKTIKEKFKTIKKDIIDIDKSYEKFFFKKRTEHRIKTIIQNINDFIDSYNQKNNKIKNIIDYDIEFAKCEDNGTFGQPNLKYKNIYNGCNKFLEKMGINKITGVTKPKKAQISDYWKQLLKNDENQKDAVNPKTDICFTAESKLYKLSIKYDDVQLASPKYADIYILFLNAINIFISKIKNQILEKSKEKDLTDSEVSEISKASKQIKEIEKKMEENNQKTFEKLQEILKIQNITTNRYATIITVAIVLDIFLSELNGQSFKDAIKQLSDKDNEAIEKMKKVIEIFEKKYSKPEEVLTKKNIEDLANEISNEFDVNANRDDVKTFIDLIKERDFNGKSIMHKLRKKRSGQILNELLTFYNNSNQITNAFHNLRKQEYKKYIEINDTKQKANANIEKIFSDEEHIKKIIGAEAKDVSDFLIKKIGENKEEIKKEIIKEAITGLRKFGNVSNPENDVYESSKNIQAIANIVFHIDFVSKSDNLLMDVNIIDTETRLDKYVESIKSKIQMDFSFKGEQHKDGSGGSFATLRIKVKNALDELLDKLKTKIKESEIENKKNETQNEKNIINIKNINDNDDKVEELFDSFNDINYGDDIYEEGFFSDLLDGAKKEVNKIYDNFKLKILRILFTSKNKASELFRLLGIRPKIKNARMPKWIVDKL